MELLWGQTHIHGMRQMWSCNKPGVLMYAVTRLLCCCRLTLSRTVAQTKSVIVTWMSEATLNSRSKHTLQFAVPQIEYPLGCSSKTGSHVPVDCCHGTIIVTSDCTIVTSEQHLYQTIVQFDETIVLPIHHYSDLLKKFAHLKSGKLIW